MRWTAPWAFKSEQGHKTKRVRLRQMMPGPVSHAVRPMETTGHDAFPFLDPEPEAEYFFLL